MENAPRMDADLRHAVETVREEWQRRDPSPRLAIALEFLRVRVPFGCPARTRVAVVADLVDASQRARFNGGGPREAAVEDAVEALEVELGDVAPMQSVSEPSELRTLAKRLGIPPDWSSSPVMREVRLTVVDGMTGSAGPTVGEQTLVITHGGEPVAYMPLAQLVSWASCAWY